MPENGIGVKLIAYSPNARNDDQRRECEVAQANQKCLFCLPDGVALTNPDDPVILETENWNIKQNKHPYPGAEIHLVAIPKTHITDVTELPDVALLELFHMVIPWAKERFHLPGYGLFVRDNPVCTGGTIYHVHFQLILAELGKTVNVPFGPRRE